jgi:hypothetical protein
MANFSELQIVKRFEELKGDDFPDDWGEGLFEFALFFDHNSKAGGYVLHDDAEKAFLYVTVSTYCTTFKKYSFIETMLQWSILDIILSSLFLYLRSCRTSFKAHSRPSFLRLACMSKQVRDRLYRKCPAQLGELFSSRHPR